MAKQITTKADGRITTASKALSTLIVRGGLNKQEGVSIRTLIVLVFWRITKMLSEKSVERAAVGKYHTTLAAIADSLISTFKVEYINPQGEHRPYQTVRKLPARSTAIPQFYNFIKGVLQDHTTAGMAFKQKGVTNHLATPLHYITQVVRLCKEDTNTLLKAFDGLDPKVVAVVDQIISNPTALGKIMSECSTPGHPLYNYSAMAVLEQATAVPNEPVTEIPSGAVTQYTPWLTKLADAITTGAKKDKKGYLKFQHRIATDPWVKEFLSK